MQLPIIQLELICIRDNFPVFLSFVVLQLSVLQAEQRIVASRTGQARASLHRHFQDRRYAL